MCVAESMFMRGRNNLLPPSPPPSHSPHPPPSRPTLRLPPSLPSLPLSPPPPLPARTTPAPPLPPVLLEVGIKCICLAFVVLLSDGYGFFLTF